MAQTLLISLSNFAAYRGISANINQVKKLEPYILEAQQFDLKPLLGGAMFADLIADFEASPALAIYGDLFNGSSWVNSDKTYRHEGLIPVLCYFTYSRYVMNSNVHDTAFGTVHKIEQFSEKAEDRTVIRLAQDARSGAIAYWEDVKKFLDDNYLDYPLWECIERNVRPKITSVNPDLTIKKKPKFRK